MATKKKKAKKKAAKKAPKRTVAKKKPAKRRAKKPPKVRLRKVPEKDYAICWDASRDNCHFGHKRGVGGPIGCGVCDAIFVFSGNERIYVLSVNYQEPYACLEAFVDAGGVERLLFAEPKDMSQLFGDDVTKFSPKQVAERLAGVMEA